MSVQDDHSSVCNGISSSFELYSTYRRKEIDGNVHGPSSGILSLADRSALPPDPLAGFKGPTSTGGKGERRGRGGNEGKGEEAKRGG